MDVPRHQRSSHPLLQILAVVVGGFLGSGLRYVGTTYWAPSGGTVSWTDRVPWSLLVINFVGVFVASVVLLRVLESHHPDGFPRLIVITGFLGGFTSYSGLFVDLARIWHLSVWGALITGFLAVASGALSFVLAYRVSKRT